LARLPAQLFPVLSLPLTGLSHPSEVSSALNSRPHEPRLAAPSCHTRTSASLAAPLALPAFNKCLWSIQSRSLRFPSLSSNASTPSPSSNRPSMVGRRPTISWTAARLPQFHLHPIKPSADPPASLLLPCPRISLALQCHRCSIKNRAPAAGRPSDSLRPSSLGTSQHHHELRTPSPSHTLSIGSYHRRTSTLNCAGLCFYRPSSSSFSGRRYTPPTDHSISQELSKIEPPRGPRHQAAAPKPAMSFVALVVYGHPIIPRCRPSSNPSPLAIKICSASSPSVASELLSRNPSPPSLGSLPHRRSCSGSEP
jgi:hypothetical protein